MKLNFHRFLVRKLGGDEVVIEGASHEFEVLSVIHGGSEFIEDLGKFVSVDVEDSAKQELERLRLRYSSPTVDQVLKIGRAHV